MTYLAEKAQDYYVCVEYGNNGHPHIEAFASFKSVQRQDKMKDKIIKLYNITDRIEKKNISVTFNSVDPDPKYGYGYACKEDPSVYATTLSSEKLEEAKEYYERRKDEVKKILSEMRKERVHINIDMVLERFVEYLLELQIKKVYTWQRDGGYNQYDDLFKEFYMGMDFTLPYTQFNKVKGETVLVWINLEIAKRLHQKGLVS